MTDLRLLTLRETQALLRVGKTTLFELIRERDLPVVRLGPRLVRVHPDALEKWLSEQGIDYREGSAA